MVYIRGLSQPSSEVSIPNIHDIDNESLDYLPSTTIASSELSQHPYNTSSPDLRDIHNEGLRYAPSATSINSFSENVSSTRQLDVDIYRYSFEGWNWHRINKITDWCGVTLIFGVIVAIIGITIKVSLEGCGHENVWLRGKIIYRVSPEHFFDSGHDNVGDLNGMLKRLDYISELGVNLIHLTNTYESRFDENGTESITNQSILKKYIGSTEDLKKLIAAAHAKDMKVLFDFWPSYTSNQHNWFMESKKQNQEHGNKYAEFYVWRNLPLDGLWEYDSTRNQYYLCHVTRHQPVLNWESEELREALHDIFNQWMSYELDGFCFRDLDILYIIKKSNLQRILNSWLISSGVRSKIILCAEGSDLVYFNNLVKMFHIVETPLMPQDNVTFHAKRKITQGASWTEQNRNLFPAPILEFSPGMNRSLIRSLFTLVLLAPGIPVIQSGQEVSLMPTQQSVFTWNEGVPMSQGRQKSDTSTYHLIKQLISLRKKEYSISAPAYYKSRDGIVSTVDLSSTDEHILVMIRSSPNHENYAVVINTSPVTLIQDLSALGSIGIVELDTMEQEGISKEIRLISVTLQPTQALVFRVL